MASLILAHGVTYFKYASILLQEMTIEVDEDFLFAFLDFAKFSGASGTEPPKYVPLLTPHAVKTPFNDLVRAACSRRIQRAFLSRRPRPKAAISTSKSCISNPCNSTSRS